MTVSNSQKKSLEEILVDNIRNDKLFALVGDEDALTEIARRAIHEALFQRQTRKEGSGYSERTVTVSSMVVEAAQESAKRYVDLALTQIFKELMESPEQKQAVRDAVLAILPAAINDRWRRQLDAIVLEGANAALQTLRNMPMGLPLQAVPFAMKSNIQPPPPMNEPHQL